MFKKFLLFAFAFTCFAGVASNASASNLAELTNAAESRSATAATQVERANPTATISRRGKMKPRKMTIAKASRQAWVVAEYIYTDPEMSWDGYGVRPCKRVNRSKVSCYSYVTEDTYDEYGNYEDTALCDWFTVSYYTRNGKSKVWSGDVDCVYLSEI